MYEYICDAKENDLCTFILFSHRFQHCFFYLNGSLKLYGLSLYSYIL